MKHLLTLQNRIDKIPENWRTSKIKSVCSINSGEYFAKWHIKLEEAIFTENYSKSGQKPQAESKTDNSSQENSGDAANEG